jgi:hypothetical protein
MKKLITTCVLLTSVTMVSFAQSKATSKSAVQQTASPAKAATVKSTMPSPEQYAERRAKAAQQQYGLTADQYKGVYAAELEYEQQYQQAKANGYEPGPGQSMQMKMGRDQKIKSAMSAEQYTKYEAAQKSAR